MIRSGEADIAPAAARKRQFIALAGRVCRGKGAVQRLQRPAGSRFPPLTVTAMVL